MLHAREAIDAILRTALLLAGRHGAIQRHLPFLHRDLHGAGIHAAIDGQPVAGVLKNTLVRARVVGGAAAGMVLLPPACCVLVPEPAGDLVARPLEEAALVLLI